MSRFLAALVMVNLVAVLLLAGLLAAVLIRPSFWFGGAYEARSKVSQVERRVASVETRARVLEQAARRAHQARVQQQPYNLGIANLCDTWRSARGPGFPPTDFLVVSMRTWANDCDQARVPHSPLPWVP